MDYEIFSGPRLLQADTDATIPADREHVTSYLHQNRTGDMRLLNLPWDGGDASQYRLTLDTPDDRKLLTTLIEQFDAADLNCADLVAIMGKHPELHAINEHIEQKKLGE
jgi:spore coat polysaccharide biosynthesis protein SpsF